MGAKASTGVPGASASTGVRGVSSSSGGDIDVLTV